MDNVYNVFGGAVSNFSVPVRHRNRLSQHLPIRSGHPSTLGRRLWRLWLRSQSSRSAALAACPSALHWAERISFEREGEPVVFMVDIGVVLF